MFYSFNRLKVNISVILILVAIFVGHSTSQKCKTTNEDGPQKNRSCVFPFIYQEITFESCTNRSDPDNKFWCSTKVDKDGKHVGNRSEWGFCDRDCEEGKGKGCIPDNCVFPFIFRGGTFNECTREGDTSGKLWCSTKTDESGQHVKKNWAYCDKGCDLETDFTKPATTKETTTTEKATTTETTATTTTETTTTTATEIATTITQSTTTVTISTAADVASTNDKLGIVNVNSYFWIK